MDLPIDVVGQSYPPIFRWRQIVDTPVGTRVVDHEGMLPPHIEGAVYALVVIAKQLVRENEELKKPVNTPQGATKKAK